MTPCTRVAAGPARPRTGHGRRVAAALLGAALVAAGCLGGGGATFSPSGACLADGQVAGAYPDLEARVPRGLDATSPTMVDSGRNCTDGALGSLISHDVHELRFAGATWDFGNGLAAGSVVFEALGRELPAAWIAEFYEIGARTAKRTEHIETSRPTFEDVGETARLDTLNELSLQTIVTWQDGAAVRAVLVASPVSPDASRADHDALVERAVAATAASMGGGVLSGSPSAAP